MRFAARRRPHVCLRHGARLPHSFCCQNVVTISFMPLAFVNQGFLCLSLLLEDRAKKPTSHQQQSVAGLICRSVVCAGSELTLANDVECFWLSGRAVTASPAPPGVSRLESQDSEAMSLHSAETRALLPFTGTTPLWSWHEQLSSWRNERGGRRKEKGKAWLWAHSVGCTWQEARMG